MKYILTTAIVMALSLCGYTQVTRLSATQRIIHPAFTDTTAANAGNAKEAYNVIYLTATDELAFRNNANTKWTTLSGFYTASNGVTKVGTNFKHGGLLTDAITALIIDQSKIYQIKAAYYNPLFNASRTDKLWIGDSLKHYRWKNGIATFQEMSLVNITQHQSYSNYNPAFLAMSCNDTNAVNGWVFMNYLDFPGQIVPRLETYSNAVKGQYGYHHRLYAKDTTAPGFDNTGPMYMLELVNYDSLDRGTSFPMMTDTRIKRRKLYNIRSGYGSAITTIYTDVFTIDSAGNIGINQFDPEQKLHVKGQVKIDTLNTGTNTDSLVVVKTGVLKKVKASVVTGGIDKYNEVIVSDGTTTVTLANAYVSGTIRLYRLGARIDPNQITEATATTITLSFMPVLGDRLIADYKY